MKIAYVCADPGVPVFGCKGCSIHVQEILRGLLAVGAEIELFAVRTDGPPSADLAQIPVHGLPALPKGDPAARERAACDSNRVLRAALERSGPFDLVYERYSLWSYAAMEYAAATRTVGMLEVNAPLIAEHALHRGLIDRPAAERATGRAFHSAAVLTAVSAEIAAYLTDAGVAAARVYVVPNGVDPRRFAPRAAPPERTGETTFTVGFLGTMKPWHGLPHLIEAFAALHREHADCRLLIVGDGPDRDRLAADVASRNLTGCVEFTGLVAPDRIPELLAAMDVAVAPYPPQPDFYFSPLKVYEYMAAGLPVVASRIGQLAELFDDGYNGLLCVPGDAVSLASALRRLRLDPALRTRLGMAARATVLANHTWEAVVRQILRLARGHGSGTLAVEALNS